MRKQTWLLAGAAILLALAASSAQRANTGTREAGFQNPAPEARLRCYWWWLNGNTGEQTITRDLEAMKANGYGGAMLSDAGGAGMQGGHRHHLSVPHGPGSILRSGICVARRSSLRCGYNV